MGLYHKKRNWPTGWKPSKIWGWFLWRQKKYNLFCIITNIFWGEGAKVHLLVDIGYRGRQIGFELGGGRSIPNWGDWEGC